MKKIIVGAAVAIVYMMICYMQRGYFNLISDLVVIGFASAAYAIFSMETEEKFGDVQEAAGMYERMDDAA